MRSVSQHEHMTINLQIAHFLHRTYRTQAAGKKTLNVSLDEAERKEVSRRQMDEEV